MKNNTFRPDPKTTTMGEVLYHTINELSQSDWHMSNIFLNHRIIRFSSKTTVHPFYSKAINVILSKAVAILNKAENLSLAVSLKNEIYLSIDTYNIQKYTTVELMNALTPLINALIKKIGSEWHLYQGDFTEQENNNLLEQLNENDEILQSRKILDKAEKIETDLLFECISKRFNCDYHGFSKEITHDIMSNYAFLVGNSAVIKNFNEAILAEMLPSMPCTTSKKETSLKQQCLSWLSQKYPNRGALLKRNAIPTHLQDDLDEIFEEIENMAALDNFAGQIVLYQTTHENFNRGFLLYPNQPTVHVGIISKEKRAWEEGKYWLNMKPFYNPEDHAIVLPLTPSQVTFYDFKIQPLTPKALQLLKTAIDEQRVKFSGACTVPFILHKIQKVLSENAIALKHPLH